MIKRVVWEKMEEYIKNDDKSIFFLWGPRRSGKTTLLKQASKIFDVPVFNFDFESDRALFVPDRYKLKKIASEHKSILIDEVQNHPEVTIALKLLHDEFGVKIIATGSSELRQKAGKDFDSLAGRFKNYYCLPLSVSEIVNSENLKAYEIESFSQDLLSQMLVYGGYPEIYTNKGNEINVLEMLRGILETYVLKDVTSIYDLKNEKLAKDILTKIALQVGSEVSIREIANDLQANVVTVSNYIEIFIKNYILIGLPAFGTNARRAVSKNRKLFFYDLGLRNILIRDFRDVQLRQDLGRMFECFVISEIEKKRKNTNIMDTSYYYREYSGAEVDLVIEDFKKNYQCFEIKYSQLAKAKQVFPLPHRFEVINSQNYMKYV